jgi:acyl-CoA thioester hydrolase
MSRIKLNHPDIYHFRTEIPVRITDLNYGNLLANEAMLAILHEARVRFLAQIGYTETDIEGTGIMMGDAAIIYKVQAFYGDVLNIDLAVTDIAKKSCDIFYRVTKKQEKIVAYAKTCIVFYDLKEQKPARIPELFLEKIAILVF